MRSGSCQKVLCQRDRRGVGTKLRVAALAVFISALAASPTGGLVVSDEAGDYPTLSGRACGSVDTVVVRLARGAGRITSIAPKVGRGYRDATTGAIVARVTGIAKLRQGGRRVVRFTITGGDDACLRSERYAEVGWETDEANFVVRYRRRGERIYMAGTDDRPRVRPRIIYIGASQRIFGLRWRSWHSRVARGRGVFPGNSCAPSCAEGRISDHPVSVRLSRPKLCDDGRYRYLVLSYRFLDGGGRPVRTTFGYLC
jgi:hypothetical protein